MENRVCKNKKCRKPLPEGYKHRYCESCRTKQAQQFKNAGKAVLSLGVTVGGAALAVVTKGKFEPKK